MRSLATSRERERERGTRPELERSNDDHHRLHPPALYRVSLGCAIPHARVCTSVAYIPRMYFEWIIARITELLPPPSVYIQAYIYV